MQRSAVHSCLSVAGLTERTWSKNTFKAPVPAAGTLLFSRVFLFLRARSTRAALCSLYCHRPPIPASPVLAHYHVESWLGWRQVERERAGETVARDVLAAYTKMCLLLSRSVYSRDLEKPYLAASKTHFECAPHVVVAHFRLVVCVSGLIGSL